MCYTMTAVLIVQLMDYGSALVSVARLNSSYGANQNEKNYDESVKKIEVVNKTS